MSLVVLHVAATKFVTCGYDVWMNCAIPLRHAMTLTLVEDGCNTEENCMERRGNINTMMQQTEVIR